MVGSAMELIYIALYIMDGLGLRFHWLYRLYGFHRLRLRLFFSVAMCGLYRHHRLFFSVAMGRLYRLRFLSVAMGRLYRLRFHSVTIGRLSRLNRLLNGVLMLISWSAFIVAAAAG